MSTVNPDMSRILTTQDVDPFDVALTVSEAFGWSALPCHLPGIETVNGQIHTWSGKRPLVRYMQYRDHKPSAAQLREWKDMFTTDAGGPNWVFITGHSTSSLALYAIDTDVHDLSPWLQSCGTTTIQSGRVGGGWHNWFTAPAGHYRTKPTLELPDDSLVRFQGVEGIIVLPGSLHASGNVYNFVNGLGIETLKPLPGWLAMSLQSNRETEQRAMKAAPFPGNTGGRDCILQMWRTNYGKGWRHKLLYVFSQELWNARNNDAFVEWALRERNKRFDEPLDESAIQECMRRGWEKTRPDNKYGALGCVTVRSDYLPWLDCSKCPHRRHMLTLGFDTALAHGLGPNEQSVLMLATTHGYKNDQATAATCHMDRRTVKKARETLQALGVWPIMPEGSKEGSCANMHTENDDENGPQDLIRTDRTGGQN